MITGTGKSEKEEDNEKAVEYEIEEILHPALRVVDMIDKICKENNCEKEDLIWKVKIKKNGQL